MSGFLSNVTARALGTAQVVQPRIPSLYEPHRAEEGPFVTRGARSAEDAAPEAPELRSARPGGEARISERMETMQTRDAARGDVPVPAAPQLASRKSQDGEGVTQRAAFTQAAPLHAASVERGEVSPPAQARFAEAVEAERPPSPMPAQAAAADWAQPDKAVQAKSDRSLASPFASEDLQPGLESERAPITKQPVRPPIAHAAEIGARSAAPVLQRAVDAIRPPLAQQPFIASAISETNVFPAIASSSQKIASSQQSSVGHVDAKSSASAPDPAPSMQVPLQESQPGTRAQVALPGAEVRSRAAMDAPIVPAFARRAELASAAAGAPVSGAGASAIEITIGTVEVRAIFPEKAAPRAKPPRPRAGVSLDEYLKRSSREAR